ncbi:MAG: hypothetical protein R2855_12195 [Thermomicrobiales bacterium]
MGTNESVEELLDLARANAQALIIATTSYLAQAGIPLDGWSAYLGHVYANSWDDSMAHDPAVFLDAVLTNYKSIGAQVHSTKLEAGRAEAVISGSRTRRCAPSSIPIARWPRRTTMWPRRSPSGWD